MGLPGQSPKDDDSLKVNRFWSRPRLPLSGRHVLTTTRDAARGVRTGMLNLHGTATCSSEVHSHKTPAKCSPQME